MPHTETAFAKINLTLKVLGKRADGYHELESLVAFAQIGDTLTLMPADSATLTTEGPFAAALNDTNLILQAADLVLAKWPEARSGAFHLTKMLPVAAGVGGGSADAAAALRLLAAANPAGVDAASLASLARALGADVPVCLASRAAMMRGIGERVTPVRDFPRAAVLLVNPGVPIATKAVFDALNASSYNGPVCSEAVIPPFAPLDRFADYLADAGNDLEAPAVRIAPVIGEVKSRLSAAPGCLASGMSGSGATCFGLFASLAEAQRAEREIGGAHAGWWVAASELQ